MCECVCECVCVCACVCVCLWPGYMYVCLYLSKFICVFLPEINTRLQSSHTTKGKQKQRQHTSISTYICLCDWTATCTLSYMNNMSHTSCWAGVYRLGGCWAGLNLRCFSEVMAPWLGTQHAFKHFTVDSRLHWPHLKSNYILSQAKFEYELRLCVDEFYILVLVPFEWGSFKYLKNLNDLFFNPPTTFGGGRILNLVRLKWTRVMLH